MTADRTPEPSSRSHRAAVRGVSLVEALVALAVMAFGMLGVVGMQSTLRFNGDLSRQRAEAVRLAQETMEDWRHYGVLTSAEATPEQPAFEDIASAGPEDIERDEFNTVYTRETVVVPEGSDAPRLRQVRVSVSWKDRRGDNQSVLLTSQIGYLPSELIALPALRSDRGPIGRPGGRNPSIPRAAVPYEEGKSRFDPPGGGGVGWVFNNDSGLIVAICPPPPATACTPANRQLVAGSIGFALPSSGGPTAADAEVPSSMMPADMTVGMGVDYVLPTPRGRAACFTLNSVDRRRVSYYCAVPLNAFGEWRGTVDPEIQIAGEPARSEDFYPSATVEYSDAGPTDASAARYRVCRYTPVNRNRRILLAGYTPAELLAHNTLHPWQYYFAKGPYTDRNFLIIKAGDGSTPYQCPTEVESTAIQSNTFHHPRLPP